MSIFQLLFSFSGRINKKRFFWATSFIGLPAALFYWFLIATTVGFDGLLSMEPGSPKAENLAMATLIYLGAVNYIHATLMFKRIRDTRFGNHFSWFYMVLLLLITFLTAGNILVGNFGGGIGLSMLGLASWAMWFTAWIEKSVPSLPERGQFVPDHNATGYHNDEADAIIARAIEERRRAQEAQRKPVSQQAPPRRPAPVSFGSRPKPDFGQRC